MYTTGCTWNSNVLDIKFHLRLNLLQRCNFHVTQFLAYVGINIAIGLRALNFSLNENRYKDTNIDWNINNRHWWSRNIIFDAILSSVTYRHKSADNLTIFGNMSLHHETIFTKLQVLRNSLQNNSKPSFF